jgi:hypothetical protein
VLRVEPSPFYPVFAVLWCLATLLAFVLRLVGFEVPFLGLLFLGVIPVLHLLSFAWAAVPAARRIRMAVSGAG